MAASKPYYILLYIFSIILCCCQPTFTMARHVTTNPGYLNLLHVQQQLALYDQKSNDYKKFGSFQGITYALSQGNHISFIQTPNIWGKNIAQQHFFTWDGKSVDFQGLPNCTHDQNICKQWHAPCRHLKAFYNGISGLHIKRCVGPVDPVVDQIYNVMIQAHHSIDMTVFGKFPNGRFLATMRNALTWLAVHHRPIHMRVILGQPISLQSISETQQAINTKATNINAAFVRALTRDIPHKQAKFIHLYVASQRSCTWNKSNSCIPSKVPSFLYKFSWNHAKIIDVDGKSAIVGGHNWYTTDYLAKDPVNDISVKVTGPAAQKTEPFIDSLWNYICKGGNHTAHSLAAYQSWHAEKNGTACLAHMPLPSYNKQYKYGIPILTMGRLALGLYKNNIYFDGAQPGNQSEIARNIMFKQAKHVIRISQQNLQNFVPLPGLGFLNTPTIYPPTNAAGNVNDILGRFLLNGGQLYIVTSNYLAVTQSGEQYYNQSTIGSLADTIKNHVIKLAPNKSMASINALLCHALNLTTVHNGGVNKWIDGQWMGNHAKVWVIDNKDYYVGSHNMYPFNNQEFGYIIGDKKSTQRFLNNYWKPLWKHSSVGAISGHIVPLNKCYFLTPHWHHITCKTRIEKTKQHVQYAQCTDNGTAAVNFVTAKANVINAAQTKCRSVKLSAQHFDIWKGCGQDQLGSQNYKIRY